jgi:hypothetical protein
MGGPFMVSLHALAEQGAVDALRQRLAAGSPVDEPGHCGATAFMAAIASKHEELFEFLLEAGADPDCTDDFNHTSLHVAVQHDWPYAVRRLIDLGMDLGRNPKYPLKQVDYNVDGLLDDVPPVPMLEEMRGLIDGETWHSLSAGTSDMMEEMGANPSPEPVIGDAVSVEVLQILLDAGERLEDADADLRQEYIGLPSEAPLSCSKGSFLVDGEPRFGTANPERVDSEFLTAMVRCGGNAYVARQKFDDMDLDRPIWCYDRFGHSLTKLPDGRFIGIAGEHEDHYDPDFYIYNDVFIHDGSGGVEIFRYPRQVFPPTDFHTASLVEERIFIIGSLGYVDERKPGKTPVFQLDLTTMAISAVETTGGGPGWISGHRARYDPSSARILISGGEVWHQRGDDGEMVANDGLYSLDLQQRSWTLV